MPVVGKPKRERQMGLSKEVIGTRELIAYDPGLALLLCEEVAQGKTLVELSDPKKDGRFPSRATIYRWIINNPELSKAYAAARELSAHSFEEEALGMARAIKLLPESGTKVRAYEVAMGQMRWSAARRNPREFGDRGNLSIVVPVQITTPMDLGEGPGSSPSLPGVYDLVPPTPEAPEVPPLFDLPEKPSRRLYNDGTRRKKARKRVIRGHRVPASQDMREARERYAREHPDGGGSWRGSGDVTSEGDPP